MPSKSAVVQFVYGTQAQYNALANKDANTLYFCDDTARIFVGDKEYTRPVSHGSVLPEGYNPPNSFFLVDGENNKELHYSQDGTSWVKIAVLPKAVTAGTFGETASKTAEWGGTITIPKITIDENGYATAGENIQVTLPELPEETALSKTDEGDGNVVSEITVNGHTMTIKKGITAMTPAGGAFTGPITIQAPNEDMNPATKQYVDNIAKSMTQFNYEIVDALPATGVKGTIYLVASTEAKDKNKYNEYLWVKNGEAEAFELIGNLDIDLSGYAKLTDLPGAAEVAPAAPGDAATGTSTKYAREDHVHPKQTDVTGNAGTADKLKTARTIGVGGALTGDAQSFDGSGDVTIDVTSVDGSKVTGKVGSAGTADKATQATQDGDGNVIKDTYATKQEVQDGKMTWGTFE